MYIGTAGWNIPKSAENDFPRQEPLSHLERYSRQLNAVEINSSFYRDHQPKTYARWAETVPPDFRFSVKISRRFTHEECLQTEKTKIRKLLLGICELGEKLGALLVQLPPSLAFSPEAEGFFSNMRAFYDGNLVLEPRHPTWTSPLAQNLLAAHRISKVAADPERCVVAQPHLWDFSPITYFRLHGSPEIYKSNYGDEYLRSLLEAARERMQTGKEVWCIFDNTAFGHAWTNALTLKKMPLTHDRGIWEEKSVRY